MAESKASLRRELEDARRHIVKLKRDLANRELTAAAGRKEISRLALAFQPARIRA